MKLAQLNRSSAKSLAAETWCNFVALLALISDQDMPVFSSVVWYAGDRVPEFELAVLRTTVVQYGPAYQYEYEYEYYSVLE